MATHFIIMHNFKKPVRVIIINIIIIVVVVIVVIVVVVFVISLTHALSNSYVFSSYM